MSSINKQALLIENGQLVADTLRHLANNEIDSDYFAIVSESENGTEIEHELAITDYALQAAGTVDELAKALEAAEKRIAELEAESEERRQFILNGVEMGFIRLPDKETRDPATATYERCLNGIQYMPCPKCNDTGMADSGGMQPWGEPIEIECDCRHQDANTADLLAAGIITKVGE